MKIYPYMNGSKSAKELAKELGIKVLKRDRDAYIPRCDVLINWGSSDITRSCAKVGELLNSPQAVGAASNKLKTFKLFEAFGVPTVPWTTEQATLIHWLAGGDTVVVRNKLSGHSGEGIEIISKETVKMNEVPKATLYTKYVKKEQEYRIHVFQGEVIFQQRKARKKDVPDDQVNWQVRNLAGGFIFANDGVVAPDSVQQAAIAAVEALGLDFGAADVGFHKDTGAVVYEVNTAMGLQPDSKSLNAYVQAFKKFL